MLRYLTYLAIYIPVQLFAYLITPLLPLFAVKRMGWCDNHSYESVEWRLPLWLAWFDTPDNPLIGDANWLHAHFPVKYWDKVGWLYRNSLYGFKWSVLAAPNNPKVCTVIEGPGNLNHHTGTYGVMRITRTDGYWQLKIVTPSKVFKGRIWVLNFGWLLDDPSQERALFMFSPRLK
jgi:hypothetical protein